MQATYTDRSSTSRSIHTWTGLRIFRWGLAKAAERPRLGRGIRLLHQREKRSAPDLLTANSFGRVMTRVDLVVWVSAQTFPRPVTPGESGQVIVGFQRGRPFRANILGNGGHISLNNGYLVTECASDRRESLEYYGERQFLFVMPWKT